MARHLVSTLPLFIACPHAVTEGRFGTVDGSAERADCLGSAWNGGGVDLAAVAAEVVDDAVVGGVATSEIPASTVLAGCIWLSSLRTTNQSTSLVRTGIGCICSARTSVLSATALSYLGICTVWISAMLVFRVSTRFFALSTERTRHVVRPATKTTATPAPTNSPRRSFRSATLWTTSGGSRLKGRPDRSGSASPMGTANVGSMEAACSGVIGRRLVSIMDNGDAAMTGTVERRCSSSKKPGRLSAAPSDKQAAYRGAARLGREETHGVLNLRDELGDGLCTS